MPTKKKPTRKTPADQKTKAKAPTELQAAEAGVKKEKTTTIADFRRALAIGRENNDKYKKTGGKDKITLKIMGGNGKESSISLPFNIKLFKAGDWVKYSAMQHDTVKGKEVIIMSEYAAALIIGCIDDKGERIFSPKDAPILENSANAVELMRITTEILTASGATGDQDAVEKPVQPKNHYTYLNIAWRNI